jgi:tetratricopeptide (TPR) repeat protein
MDTILLAISFIGFISFFSAIFYYLTSIRKRAAAELLKEKFKKIEELLPRYVPEIYEREEMPKETEKSLLDKEESVKKLIAEMDRTEAWADPELYYKVGIYYLTLKKYEFAIENFEKAIRINPYQKFVYFHIGVIYIKLRNWENAIECFKKSIERNEEKPEAYYNLGWIYDEMENYKEAIMYYEKSLETFYDAIYNKACSLAKWGKEDEAIEELRKIIDREEVRKIAQTDPDLRELREKGKLEALLKTIN